MNKIKRMLRRTQFKTHVCYIFVSIALLFAMMWIYITISKIAFFVLLPIWAVLFVVEMYYAINRLTLDHICMIKFKEFEDNVRPLLSKDERRVYVYPSSKLDKHLTYYAGFDNKDKLIFVYGRDSKERNLYQYWGKDYIWFMENFYVM